MSVKPIGGTPPEQKAEALEATRPASRQGVGQTPSSLDCSSCCSDVVRFFEWVASGLVWLWNWLTTDGPAMSEPTAIEQEALDFAEKEWKSAGSDTAFCGLHALNVTDPINRQVRQMMTLYRAARQRFENPLNKQTVEEDTVKEAAKRCLYLGYAIGYLTLKNLPKDIRFLNEINKDAILVPKHWNYTRALTHDSVYQSIAILLVAQVYHRMRGHVVFNSKKCQFQYPESVATEYTARFYQEGTLENNFRKLHNALCQRAWLYLSKEDLGPFSDHLPKWLQEDTPEKPLAIDPEILTENKYDPLGLPVGFDTRFASHFAYGWSSIDLPASVASTQP